MTMRQIAPDLYEVDDCTVDCSYLQCPATCSEVKKRLQPAPIDWWITGDVATMSRGE